MSRKRVLAIIIAVTTVLALGTRITLAGPGNSRVTASKMWDPDWEGAVKIVVEDQDGLSNWIVYHADGYMMQARYYSASVSGYPMNSEHALGGGAVPMFVEETGYPLKVKVEDRYSDVDWWKIYSNMSAKGPYKDPECTELYIASPIIPPHSFYVLIIIVVAIGAAIAFLGMRRTKKPKEEVAPIQQS